MIIDILVKYQNAFAEGLATTFRLSFIIWFVGLFLGALLAPWVRDFGFP